MKELENIEDYNIDNLYSKISERIENAKRNIAIQVNNEMTILYWNIGKDIYEYFLNFEILPTLSTKLSWSHFIELL